LFLYPGSFRRDYGDLMAQAFGDRLHERGAARTWAEVASDLVRSIPEQIMEVSLMNRNMMPALAAVGAGLIVAAMLIGLGSPMVILIGGLGLLAILLALSARRAPRSSEYSYVTIPPKAWTWWTVLAVGLGFLYVIPATGQLISNPKATHFGALGAACAFAGLIGLGLFLRSRSRTEGNWLVAFATVPALAFFWAIWPPVVAIAVMVGSVKEISGRSPQAPAAA
jgi:hypothetical protein